MKNFRVWLGATLAVVFGFTYVYVSSSGPVSDAGLPTDYKLYSGTASVGEGAAAGTLGEILSRFQRDIQACKNLIEEIKNDKAFVASFLPSDARNNGSYVNFLRESSFSRAPATQYVILNQQYLHLGQDYHEVPWAVAWGPDGIYCAPTFGRLREIENSGESSEAWQIRKFFLDGGLSSLVHPSTDMTDGFLDFHELESLLQEALDLYRGPQRSSLYSWMEEAIREIEQSRKDVSAESGRLTLTEQHDELDYRIVVLRRMLSL
jgi:hypothetical protein